MLDCPLKDVEALNNPMRYSCMKVLNLYCKVFNQQEIFDLIVRKTCQACKCPRENHEIYHEQLQNVKERLGMKLDSKTSQIDPKKLGYTWTPPGILTSSKIQRYFDLLPQDKVPKCGSQGEKYREKQLSFQLPRQDLTINYCKHVDTENRASYDDFIAVRNELALDVGYVKDAQASGNCPSCKETINQGEMCVNAPKLSDDLNFHPRCFKCTTCDELLVDLTYCVYDEKLYCERHYAENLKPRCHACDESRDCYKLKLEMALKCQRMRSVKIIARDREMRVEMMKSKKAHFNYP
ncbi:hypothetical protein PVAND_007257 [Polypedilum vanderplanki]|uniref:Uncharacterized protein n=1 Tax=Polypedilum vanderplanki TaxID=319348 RepID=A0A9J6C5P3_POLVA|nr:hypothetical protein PVAND_007257 [Polypedilum vanderplanki]